MPYQGLTVKSLLEKQGRVFNERAIRLAYPKLCEPIVGPRKPGKFRMGYISGSLTNGHNCKWALGWLRNHSPEIETHAFNLGSEDIGSKMWAESADRYYRLEGNLQRIAEFIRSKELDALIITDIGSFPRDFIYFSLRLARIQCTAWGIPTTSGLPNVDYYLSSELMEPQRAEAEYTERLVRLPRSGLCYPRPKTSFWTSEFTGKSKEFFPFMAQNIRKWTPQQDPLLKRIADRYGKPLKFLSLPDPELTRQFSERITKSGVQHEMLPLAYPKAYANHLRSASVSFDPPDWSGGNTTIEALSYGVPVVTLPGPFMRGRHSAAFLEIANAEGLIAKNEDDFVDLVFDQDRQKEAMKNLDVDALYDDKGVVEALDAFLFSTSNGLV
jgi:predicted O-linked N-acetylglucosamine transferase (SPINDLY family)